jgi:hypothetical protein
MKGFLPALALSLPFMFPTAGFAQRDAPVWESHLSRISVYNNNRTSSVLELDYKKEGGHYVHDHHQLYVMAYLQKDEAEILKMVPKEEAPKKKGPAKKFFLDLLIEKKLVKVLQTKATKVHPWNYKDQHDRRNHVYSFKFHFEHKALFETVESLVNFDSDNISVYGTKKDITLYGDKFKMMVFVPVNTNPYATKIPMNLRKQYDFPPGHWRLRPIHYFRPLPYVFELKRVSDGFLLYKN